MILKRGTMLDATVIETSAARLAHLEHALFIASCVREADAVTYTAYRVT